MTCAVLRYAMRRTIAILALITGILIGAYFGNYRGRAGVMDAWQRDLQIQYKKLREERTASCND